ncbi:MAG: hypothetical protein V1933_05425, partial [Candidatus Omnitrophota bacterium]
MASMSQNFDLKNDFIKSPVYRAEKLSTGYALTLSKKFIEPSNVFTQIKGILNDSELAIMYFQVLIKYKIYPIIYEICERDLSSAEGGPDETKEARQEDMDSRLLDAVCGLIPAGYKNEWLYKLVESSEKIRKATPKSFIKETFFYLRQVFNATYMGGIPGSPGMIAVKYGEGLDLLKRSDIFWFKDSGIAPSDILIFFQFSDGAKFHINRQVISEIEKFGFRWVCLGKAFSDAGAPVWYPKRSYMETKIRNSSKSKLDKWIYIVGRRLIKDVSYWTSFIREFNVKILFVKDERLPETIAQNIAFEMTGDKGGFLCGHQRSELSYPAGSLLGNHPKNILFTWSDRSRDYFNQSMDPLLANVITGYSFDVIYKSASGDIKNRVDALRSGGAKIVVTLFDNVHGGLSNPISTPLIKEFYEVFLNWALEDKEAAIIVKSKKKLVFDNLRDVKELIAEAERSGRCLVVEENKLPSEASRFSDFAIGIGISTSVTESALAGCRGIHCDLTGLKSHHFYKW